MDMGKVRSVYRVMRAEMLNLSGRAGSKRQISRHGGKSWPQAAAHRRQIAAAPTGDTLSTMKEFP
jgi:hypothetical protein